MDTIEHALDDFSRAIIDRDNFPLTLHELAQAPTKDSDALYIETIGNLVDSVLRALDDLVRLFGRGGLTWFWWQSGIRNSTSRCSKITKNGIFLETDWSGYIVQKSSVVLFQWLLSVLD